MFNETVVTRICRDLGQTTDEVARRLQRGGYFERAKTFSQAIRKPCNPVAVFLGDQLATLDHNIRCTVQVVPSRLALYGWHALVRLNTDPDNVLVIDLPDPVARYTFEWEARNRETR